MWDCENDQKHTLEDLVSVKIKKGETAFRSSPPLRALRLKDRKDVYVLTTMHADSKMMDTGKED